MIADIIHVGADGSYIQHESFITLFLGWCHNQVGLSILVTTPFQEKEERDFDAVFKNHQHLPCQQSLAHLTKTVIGRNIVYNYCIKRYSCIY